MGLREDMAAACRDARSEKKDPCGGEVVLTDAHWQEADHNEQEILMLATQGCRSGCRCIDAEARIEDRDGVKVVIARCTPDPRAAPFNPHGVR